MEAALRTAVETLTNEELPDPVFSEVRGTDGIKKATYNVAGMDVNVAVVSGLSNAKVILDEIQSGNSPYHLVEIMACPGGCVNGGGQPQQPASVRNNTDIRALRAKALYDQDASMKIRKSHENSAVKKLYEEFLEAPGSHKAHEILHTSYVKRAINPY
jgi:NADP-reducing hydrogenase subunit HndD